MAIKFMLTAAVFPSDCPVNSKLTLCNVAKKKGNKTSCFPFSSSSLRTETADRSCELNAPLPQNINSSLSSEKAKKTSEVSVFL